MPSRKVKRTELSSNFNGSSGIFWEFFIGQKHAVHRSAHRWVLGPRRIGGPGRAYSRGLGESVTRGDRRERELEFGSSFPPLASPCEYTARFRHFLKKGGPLSQEHTFAPIKTPRNIPEEANP